jgi:hypothetical protein
MEQVRKAVLKATAYAVWDAFQSLLVFALLIMALIAASQSDYSRAAFHVALAIFVRKENRC